MQTPKLTRSGGTVSSGGICPAHVGRDHPVGLVRERVVSAERTGSLLLVTGEAGIGKTRLCAEAIAAARRRGIAVLAATCHAGSAVPYDPFVTVIRRRLRGLERSEVRELFGGAARLASTLLPELAEAVDPIQAAEVAGAQVDAAVVELIVRLAADGPCLLVIEDLHWAGADTVRLALHLVRELDALDLRLVLSHRPDAVGREHPLTPALAEARRHRRCAEIDLEPLDVDDVATMVSALAMGGDRGFAEAIHRRTGGNPLFVEELCKVVADRGGSAAADGSPPDATLVELPRSIRSAVLDRLDGAVEAHRTLLLVAAVGGEPIDPAVLGAATGMPSVAIDAAILDGLERGVLNERRDAALPAYHFRHPLIREALLGELRGPALRDAHRRIAVGLLSAGGDAAGAAGSVADHFAAAGDGTAALPHARLAARQAAARGAWAETVARLDQAVALSPPLVPERLAAHVEAAETLRSADPALAADHVAAGRALARQLGDRVALSRLATVDGLIRWWRGDGEGSVACQREAYELVRSRGDDQEMRPLLELARYHANRDEEAVAQELLDRGGQLLAAGVGTARDRADHHNIHAVLGRDDADIRERYDAAIAAAQVADDEPILGVTLGDAGLAALWYLGDLRRARACTVRAIEVMQIARPGHAVAYRAALAWIDAVRGDLIAAELAAEEIRAQDDNAPALVMALLARVEVRQRRGAAEAARRAAAEAVAVADRLGEKQWMVPALGAAARVTVAHSHAEGLALADEALLRGRGPHWSFSPDVARALAQAGRIDDLVGFVARVARVTDMAERHRHDLAALRLCQGLRGAALARRSARRHLDEACSLYRAIGCPAREAEVDLALGELALREGRPGDAGAAAAGARALAERLGSAPLLDEAAAQLRRAGVRTASGTPRPHEVTPGTLSARERDVVDLIAEGCSNAEIGRRLFLSKRTVESHVSHILVKLDLRNRMEISRWRLGERTRAEAAGAAPGRHTGVA